MPARKVREAIYILGLGLHPRPPTEGAPVLIEVPIVAVGNIDITIVLNIIIYDITTNFIIMTNKMILTIIIATK